jgi:hypothetical protein
VETTGWRIAKEKASRKIDVVVPLEMSALGGTRRQDITRFILRTIAKEGDE